ncbi:flavin-containing amine oxidoreductase-domain containing protein [Lipomyces orientalis]|uniref:Flavin-containing amine oxidoreductase-domain containing protein n=1 Tax=Lipomyces orientalis TaxID=1233043 RepID=A0ACC3TN28_9ASCO
MAQSNPAGGGGQATASAPGGYYLPAFSANMGMDILNASQQKPPQLQQNHPQRQQPEQYTNYDSYYQSTAYSDQGLSADMSQLVRQGHEQSHHHDQATFEQDLGAALGIDTSDVGSPNRQVSLENGQENGHNIWAQFLESQQDSILAWDQDQHLEQTSEVHQPASTAPQSNAGHSQYQYSNGDSSSSIAGYSQMNNQYGIYGEPYGLPHTALPYQQTPTPPPPHLQHQQQQQVQHASRPQQYQFVSQQRPRSHAIYGNHPPHQSSFDPPMPPSQLQAQQQQAPPRQSQIQTSMTSQMQSPIQQSMHSRIEEPVQQSISSTPAISATNGNGSGRFYDSQSQQPSVKQEAMEQQPDIMPMHNLQCTPNNSPSFLPPQTTPTQTQLQQPVHPHSQASVPFQHQAYIKSPLPPHLQQQQEEQQRLQLTAPNAVPASQPRSQAKAKRQPSQQSTPVLQNKFVVPAIPAANPSSSMAFEPPRKRVRNASATVTTAAAPDLMISTVAATSMPITQEINSVSSASSPTLSTLKIQRREDKDVKNAKGKVKASPVDSIVPQSPRLSMEAGFLSPINSQIAVAPSQSPPGAVHQSILSSQIGSQPAFSAIPHPVPAHVSAANQTTPAPEIVRPDDSSRVARNHIKATASLPNSQQFLLDSGIGTMKSRASPPILKVERKNEVPKLPKLSDLDRDELLATMLAESEYVDPPMTRSEYIASLGVVPELVTTVPYNRLEYFAKSSIPSDISAEVYAREGIEAAIASRLPPYALHPLEYELLKNDINHLHVTTYLNIRNGILRLWRMNHHVSVTRAEAAGCARDPRFFGLAEAAFELLVRHGYINFGVVDIPRCRNNFPYMLTIPPVRRPRLRIVVIGAGMAGLGCARQLDGLFKQYDDFLSGYEAPPEIVILEGRQRIGGRVYSAPLRKDGDQNSVSHKVDLGGQIITGFGNGNPLAVIVRKQLGLRCHELQDAGALYDEVVGGAVSASLDRRAEGLFNDMLDRVASYRAPVVPPHTVEGDVSLVTSGKDPTGDGGRTIARMEANAVDLPPLEPTVEVGSYPLKTVGRPYTAKTTKTSLDLKLEDLGYVVSKNRSEHDIPPFTTTPVPPQAPTLGATLDRQLDIVRQLADLTAQDLRLINWHYANLEYANATSVHNLSLGSWDQDDGNEFSGKHSMLENGGYMLVPRALYVFPTRLDVRFKSSVKIVAYETSKQDGRKKFTVTMHSGERISADRVVCTVPLGVLKAGTISFQPELPETKRESIQNLGFGVLNKVVLVYDRCFWDPDKDIVGVARDNSGSADRKNQDSYRDVRGRFYMFWNCTKVVGKHCLVALMAGHAAVDTSRHPDEVLIRDATYVLSRMYPSVAIPHPTETIITRWHQDPFSRGSYSYVGPNATGDDYDILAAPTCDDNLFFAGEATSRTHPATVHGAYLSGLRAAEEVFRTVVGDITLASPLVKPRLRPNVPLQTETVTFPPPPKSAYVGEIPPVPQPVRLPHIPLEEFEMMPVDEGLVPIKRRAKPGPKPKAKSSTPVPLAMASITTSQSQAQPSSFNIISPNGHFPTKNGATGKIDPHLHLLRARQLRDQRLAAHTRECEAAISKALGSAVPQKPEKAHLNPFILFQKVNWETCRIMAEQQRRLTTGDANAKPTVADIRAVLSQKWRNLNDEEKKPVIEETNRNRVENERRFAEYKLKMVEYEEKVKLCRENWFREHESVPTNEETRELELASTVA